MDFSLSPVSWVIFSLLGTLPYLISGTIPSFIDAFFESTSGFSTTGSSILKNVEVLPFSILFWRSLTHWIGGIGMIVILIIILPSIKGQQVISYSAWSHQWKRRFFRKQRQSYSGFYLFILDWLLPKYCFWKLATWIFFDSICHSFGTVATGGFSTKNNSLAYYSSYSQYIVMVFMFLAGTSQVILLLYC